MHRNEAATVVVMQAAYTLSKTQVYERFAQFNREETAIDDQPRFGCSSSVWTEDNIDKICDLIREDWNRIID